jgi:hypothetical protein
VLYVKVWSIVQKQNIENNESRRLKDTYFLINNIPVYIFL